MYKRLLMSITAVGLLAACNGDDEDHVEASNGDADGEVTISAAASTRDALEDVVDLFNEEYPEVSIDMNFGGSGALKIQIEQGAPVDIFLSANVNHFDDLDEGGFIEERTMYLGNNLVLIEQTDAETLSIIEELVDVDLIALGTPESVPAGEYAKTALEYYEVWDEVEGNIVYAEDVRQVLQYVEIAEVDAGVVYRTDAFTSDDVVIVDTFTEDSHDAIEYPLGLLTDGSDDEAVQAFYEFLQSDAALEVFEEYGFIIE